MPFIQPTIGRRVLYWPNPTDAQGHPDPISIIDPEQPCDAGIAFVHNDRLLNLTVAGHLGGAHSRPNVVLVQDGDELPPAGAAYATWMPYQLGQAQQQLQGEAQNAQAPAPTPAPTPAPAPAHASSEGGAQ